MQPYLARIDWYRLLGWVLIVGSAVGFYYGVYAGATALARWYMGV